jgi:PAS domain S-box-containing protein
VKAAPEPGGATREAAAYRYSATLPVASQMLEQLLKATEIQQLFESYYHLIKIPVAIIDLEANVLLSSRWQRICTQFHRVHPATCARCLECDTRIAVRLGAGQTHTIAPCLNGLTDCASPIIIEGKHVANLFIGQFLTEAPDETRFRRQAEEFGFDVADYITALREVPVVDGTTIPTILDLLVRMTRVLTNLSIDRKHALEDQSRQSLILDAIPQCVFWKDPQGRYLGCNAAFVQAAGLASRADIVGKTDFELPWSRAEAETYRADDQSVISTKQPRLHLIAPLQKADGSRIVIDTSKMPLTDATGAIRGVVGIYDDISEAIAKREALAQSEENFRLLSEESVVGVYVIQDGKLVYVNPAFARVFGYSPQEIIGKLTPGELFQADDLSSVLRSVEERGAGRVEESNVVYRATKQDGSLLHVEVYGTRARFRGRHCVMGTLIDVTERTRVQAALVANEALTRGILENLQDAYLRVARDGRILMVSPSAVRLYGYDSMAEMIGQSAAALYGTDEVRREVLAELEQQGSVRDRIGKGRKKDGALFWVSLNARRIENELGEVSGAECFVRDISSRMEMQEALRTSQARYEQLVNNTDTGFVVIDDQGIVITANEPYLRLAGRQRLEEVVGHSVFEWTAPEQRENDAQAVALCARQGSLQNLETVYQHADGTRVDVIINATVEDASSRRKRIASLCRDISSRKRAEQESSSLARFERLLAELSAGLAATPMEQLDGAIFDVQKRLCDFLDADISSIFKPCPEAKGGLRLAHIYRRVAIPPVPDNMDADDYFPWCQRELLSGRPVVVSAMGDLPAVAARDQQVWRRYGIKSTVILPLMPTGGQVFGTLSFDWLREERVVPEGLLGRLTILASVVAYSLLRKQTEDDLAKQSRMLLESQRAARLGSYALDIASQMFWTSEVMDELFGIDPAHDHSVAGWAAMLHPDDRARVLDRLQKDVIECQQPFDEEFRIVRHSDQAVRWLHAQGKLELDVQGRPATVRGTSQDITERKRVEQERQSLEEQLRVTQKLEAIGRLAGGVAHDFNNLLSLILNYTGFVLHDMEADDARRVDLVQVKHAAERAAALTRQLLAFSRKQVLEPVELDLSQIARGMEKMFRRILGEDIEVVQVLAPDLWPAVADPGQIEQVLMNLVINARDAMPNGGRLTIATANVEVDGSCATSGPGLTPGPYVRLTVSDTGCGMDPSTLTKIFEPFFTTKAKDKGTGLGLSTVFGIVKQSGGEIQVASEPGRGSAFTFYLPRGMSSPSPAALAPAAVPAPAAGDETILVVEDEEELRNVARRILVDCGYQVLTAADGREALRVCEERQGTIHLVLTDVIMPEIGGKALADHLADSLPGAKIVFMSGYTDDAIAHHGVLAPSTHFIAKPFSAAELARKVRRVLDGGSIASTGDNLRAIDPEVKAQTVEQRTTGALPESLQKRLLEAVIAARYDETVALVESLRASEPELAAELRRLADQFDYEGIRGTIFARRGPAS